MIDECTQRIDPFEDIERWERYIEDRAYQRYEHQIRCLRAELDIERRRNEWLTRQIVGIELLKPLAPILFQAVTSDQAFQPPVEQRTKAPDKEASSND